MPIASSLLDKPRLVKKLRDFYTYVQKNNGQVGGGYIVDINAIYQLNHSMNLGFSIKNILESQALAFPLSPSPLRTFEFELGYKF